MIRRVLDAAELASRTRAHEERVDRLTAARRTRSREGRAHPVEDFLFTYYSWKPSRLRRWHAGVGVGITADSAAPQRDWRFYTEARGVIGLDVDAFLHARGDTVQFVRELLGRTMERPGRFGCFGLHEWAMVYRLDPADVRHASWPLRLGPAGTDRVVESHQIGCSHFDAFRFFTADAVPRNAIHPTRASQVDLEQPGCLHAGMDVYKWAMKLEPAVPSELVMDCFELAWDIRELDMRASPYDLRELGYDPVPIETIEGKTEYARQQRLFSTRSQALRARLIDVCDAVLSA